MLKNLWDAFNKLTNAAPRYVGSRCLVERHAVGGCDLCFQACPHDAIKITERVEVFDNCTGCGLCVQACPSGALEYDILPTLGALKDQGIGQETTIKCSKVPGNEPTLSCLARITSAELMASGAWQQKLTLLHADCANCRLGGPNVPRGLQKTIEIAKNYNQIDVQMIQFGGNATKVDSKSFSRREAFSSTWGKTKENFVKLIPENPLPGISITEPAEKIPHEWSWRRKALRIKDKNEVYWPHPNVNDRCIMCPVCENVCPTEAIERKRLPEGDYQLFLDVSACTGCNACVVSCPPDAMKLKEFIEKSNLDHEILLFESSS